MTQQRNSILLKDEQGNEEWGKQKDNPDHHIGSHRTDAACFQARNGFRTGSGNCFRYGERNGDGHGEEREIREDDGGDHGRQFSAGQRDLDTGMVCGR